MEVKKNDLKLIGIMLAALALLVVVFFANGRGDKKDLHFLYDSETEDIKDYIWVSEDFPMTLFSDEHKIFKGQITVGDKSYDYELHFKIYVKDCWAKIISDDGTETETKLFSGKMKVQEDDSIIISRVHFNKDYLSPSQKRPHKIIYNKVLREEVNTENVG